MIKDTAHIIFGAEPAKSAFAQPWLLGLGAMVYAISFALPAVGVTAYGSSTVSGWDCALVALTFVIGPNASFSFPLFASGLINPMTLAYLVLRVLGKGSRVRRALAIATLSFVPLSWYVIAHQLRVEIGHLAWVAGLLMMMAPEAIGMAKACLC
ncbi:MAG: hypothetical protein ACLQU1_16530 [Bryobacteraceae bacterium]